MNEQEGDFGVRTLLLSWTRSRIIMWDFSLPVFCEVHHAPHGPTHVEFKERKKVLRPFLLSG